MTLNENIETQFAKYKKLTYKKFSFDSKDVEVQVDEQGKPWFKANNVCSCLGYEGNFRDAVIRHVDTEDVVKRDTLTKGGVQQTNFVNESGLYSLILGSKLEGAKFTEKRHADVIRSIESLIKSGKFSESNFELSTYQGKRREEKVYILDETFTTVLLMGLTGEYKVNSEKPNFQSTKNLHIKIFIRLTSGYKNL